jgi:V8-like Glu-specific endopeptidase
MAKDQAPQQPVTQDAEQSTEEVLEYWTEERMREAEPVPRPQPDLPPKPRPEVTPGGEAVGAAFQVPPNTTLLPQQTANPVSNPGSWPYSAIGKLFMTMGNLDYVGSGFSVSGSKSVFMTAGHCVYDNGGSGWATNVMIALSYSPSSPGAQFSAIKLVTLQGWISGAGYAYDIGAGVVSGDMFSGRGNLGILFNQPANTGPWTAVGYPQAPPYPGNTMYQTAGSYIGPGDPGTIGMNNNDMGGGSSGGPWLVNSNWGYVNGLQSYDYGSPATDEYSPYFGVGAYNVWVCAVAGQCG